MVLLLKIFFCNTATAQSDSLYDIVFVGGRVIDPETKLDAIKNVAINNNRIAEISSESLNGKETINISGLVLAPGFIDDTTARKKIGRYCANDAIQRKGAGWQ